MTGRRLMTIPYYGGKFFHLGFILPLLPQRAGHYVEVFGGSGVVLMNRAPSPIETFNDLDDNVVNFFRVARERPDDLTRMLRFTPYSRVEHELSRKPCGDPLEKARRFVVNAVQSRNGQQISAGWRYCKGAASTSKGMATVCSAFHTAAERIAEIAERMRRVQIENDDAVAIIKRYDTRDTLFYVDPPYVADSRSKPNCYRMEMSDEDHEALAAILLKIEGRAVVSGYDSPLYRRLYADWRIVEDDAKVANASIKRPSRREVCWLNFPPSGNSTGLF